MAQGRQHRLALTTVSVAVVSPARMPLMFYPKQLTDRSAVSIFLPAHPLSQGQCQECDQDGGCNSLENIEEAYSQYFKAS